MNILVFVQEAFPEQGSEPDQTSPVFALNAGEVFFDQYPIVEKKRGSGGFIPHGFNVFIFKK
ncbi:MAG: hypothetical protein G8237_06185 [Magnetococcales bacterium]|nr:hypothetical protein [Magnetococcales bacterium]